MAREVRAWRSDRGAHCIDQRNCDRVSWPPNGDGVSPSSDVIRHLIAGPEDERERPRSEPGIERLDNRRDLPNNQAQVLQSP